MEASVDLASGSRVSATNLDTQVVDNKAISYLFWTAGLFGVCGLHRFYNGRIISGLVWMSTFGLFGIGQLIDLAYIPEMAEKRSRRLRDRQSQPNRFDSPGMQQDSHARTEPLTLRLLQLAKRNHGRLTVTECVLETEAPFAEVEHTLKELVKSGYAHVSNDVVSGVVIYEIPELVTS